MTPMNQETNPTKRKQARSWRHKFADAFRGTMQGVRGQNSFHVHFLVATLVIVAGFVLRVTLVEWCLITICIALVLAAEMFNSALESMGKAVDPQYNPHLEKALNISSAAVLLASIGASIVGTTIFVFRLGHLLRWWL